MKQLFPKLKIIYIIRNGIEVISSRMNYESFKNNSFESHCEVWNRSFEIENFSEDNGYLFINTHEKVLIKSEFMFSQLWR